MKRLGTAGTEITLFLQEGKMLKTIKKQSNKKGVTKLFSHDSHV